MKFKYLLFFFFLLASLPAFAIDYNTDIYVDDSNTSSTKTYKPATQNTNYYPKFEGHILAEYYINSLDSKDDIVNPHDSKNDYYLNLEALLKLQFKQGFFAETKWQLSPVNDRVYTGDIYAENPGYIVGNSLNSDFYGKQDYIKRKFQFSSYGLAVETLNVGYKNDNFAIGLGKINPTFAKAYDKARFSGVYGISMAEEYEMTGKIGGYISAILPVGTITFNAFFDDKTGLSRTMFNSIKKDKSEGGAGNTEKLNNFSITYDGQFENLSLNFGFRYLDVDLETEQPEKGFVLSGEYLMELPYDVNFLPFAEVAYFNNYDGMEDRNLTYFTAFLPLIIDGWHFIATSTFKFDNEDGYKNYFSHLTQLSAGYKFDCGLMLDFAKIWEKNTMKADGFAGVGNKQKWTHNSDSWAFMVSYSFKF